MARLRSSVCRKSSMSRCSRLYRRHPEQESVRNLWPPQVQASVEVHLWQLQRGVWKCACICVTYIGAPLHRCGAPCRARGVISHASVGARGVMARPRTREGWGWGARKGSDPTPAWDRQRPFCAWSPSVVPSVTGLVRHVRLRDEIRVRGPRCLTQPLSFACDVMGRPVCRF